MTAQTTNTPARLTLPSLSVETLMLVLISGAAGTLAFDLWGQAIAPLLGLGNLAPVGLARAFLGTLGLPNGAPYGNLMHLFAVGLVAYPVGWLMIWRPLQRRVMPGLPGVASATLYGVALWVFAIGAIAWIAGNPPFLGFSRITWVALAGHVLYALAAAGTAAWIERRPAA